jgi:hypothetical protein
VLTSLLRLENASKLRRKRLPHTRQRGFLALFEGEHSKIAIPDPQQVESPKSLQIVAISPLKRVEVREAAA